ncbi:hypothetical protein ACSBR1_002563 [Camellia fascicularis]
MTQFFPPRWKKFWNEWEVRGMVLISLTTQVLLVILGNRRKHSAGIQVRVVVWSAYLLADSVAAIAAGILSNHLGKVNVDGFIDPNVEITAFWAPLMLVHLGGTDAITAYFLEDNELWRRHSFQVVIQSVTTVYIFLMAWTGSLLSILFILMFVVGLFKYCERVCVLYLSTDNNFRDSIQDITTNESKIMKECKLKELEGYHVTTHQVLEVDQSIPNVENELLTAFGFLDMVKRLFADLIIGIRDGHTSRSIFDKISADKAFKITEIELGIIYDLRFTKAKVIYSNLGISLRIVGIILTFLVFDDELWAFKQLLVSDQTTHWLIKHEKTIISRAIKCILPSCESSIKTKRRWSYSMKQYSLLNFSMRLKEKPLPCRKILKMLRVDKALEIQLCKTSPISVGEILRARVFKAMNESVKNWLGKHSYDTDLKALYGRRACRTLEDKQSHEDKLSPDLKWSIVDLEFDQSILVWHLATEILYQYHQDFGGYYDQDKELEKGNWLNHEKLFISNYKDTKLGGRSNLLILHGCKLASQLKAIDDTGTRWRFIVDIWIEMLGHAASQCRGRYHAQQLRRGGEFLTHVWLLMAHFGLNDLFQVRRGGIIADAILM